MPLKGFLIDGAQVSFEDALLLALQGKTAMSLPVMSSIVAGATGKNRPGPEAGFSASQFASCARKVLLERWEDYWETPERLYAMGRGTLIHKVLEDAMEGMPADMRLRFSLEERLHATLTITLQGTGELIEQPVHGQYDLAYAPAFLPAAGMPDEAILYDHKNTRWIPPEAKREHIAQVSIYAWLLGKNGKERPVKGRITYMDNGASTCYEVILWDDDAVESYLAHRLQDLVLAERSHILPERVAPDGRWACGANRTKTRYCPFAATCWPDGVDTERDGWSARYFIRGAEGDDEHA